MKAVASKFAFGALADSYYECPACASCLTCPNFHFLCPGLFNKDLYKLQITLAFLIGIFWSSGFNIPPKRSSRSKSEGYQLVGGTVASNGMMHIFPDLSDWPKNSLLLVGVDLNKKLKWWSRYVEGCLEADFFFSNLLIQSRFQPVLDLFPLLWSCFSDFSPWPRSCF